MNSVYTEDYMSNARTIPYLGSN